jgi:hypothetical protein
MAVPVDESWSSSTLCEQVTVGPFDRPAAVGGGDRGEVLCPHQRAGGIHPHHAVGNAAILREHRKHRTAIRREAEVQAIGHAPGRGVDMAAQRVAIGIHDEQEGLIAPIEIGVAAPGAP